MECSAWLRRSSSPDRVVTVTSTTGAGREGFAGRIVQGALRVPLVAKLIGANVIIVAAALFAHSLSSGRAGLDLLTVVVSLAVASAVNVMLVRIALQPIGELERLAERVSAGNFNARNEPSLLADKQLLHLGQTVNGLLESLAAERKRIQDLGAQVVYAQDVERARVSRELHDSIAQTLAAVRFQLAAASSETSGALKNRIATASSLVGSALEEVKNVSYSLHPRVADDLGLEAALETLAAQVEERSGILVAVSASMSGPPIPAGVSGTLFRVAQEALRNIEMHSRAKTATVSVVPRDGGIRLEISDDGCGFDPLSVRSPAKRSALASVNDRVTLAGGIIKIDSVPNGGTRVTAELNTMKAAS